MESLTDFLEQRQRVHSELATGQVHILTALKSPDPTIASEPVGDVLCWCQGLDEAVVTEVLCGAGVNWGRQVRLVSAMDQKRILWQIKQRRPLVWAGWRNSLAERKAA